EDDVDVLDEQMGVGPVREVPHVQDILHFHRIAGTAGNARRVPVQDLIHAAAHGAKAQNCDLCHSLLAPILSEMCLTHRSSAGPPPPCSAWRAWRPTRRGPSAWCRCGWSPPPGRCRFPAWPG